MYEVISKDVLDDIRKLDRRVVSNNSSGTGATLISYISALRVRNDAKLFFKPHYFDFSYQVRKVLTMSPNTCQPSLWSIQGGPKGVKYFTMFYFFISFVFPSTINIWVKKIIRPIIARIMAEIKMQNPIFFKNILIS